jgi:hypothetical protein
MNCEIVPPIVATACPLGITSEEGAEVLARLVPQKIRELQLPYVDQTNLATEEAQEQSVVWVTNYVSKEKEKIQKVADYNIGLLLGKVHPQANPTILSIISDFATWLFIYDDRIEKCTDEATIRMFHTRTLQIIGGEAATTQDLPLMPGLSNIMERLHSVWSSRDWNMRFRQDVSDYCEATLWEFKNRKEGKVPSVEDYKLRRPDTSGTKIMFDFIEVTTGIEIPQELVTSEDFQTIRLLGANLVNWENDIISAPKELKQKDIHNLIIAYKHQYSIGYEEALQLASRDLIEALDQFQDMCKAYSGASTEAVDANIKGITEWIAANHFWSIKSRRYTDHWSEQV